MKLDFDIEAKGESLDFELKDTKVINTGGGVSENRVVQIVEEKTKELQPKTDKSLETESKQVSGAINEVNSSLVKGINSSITEETNELVLELKGKDGTVLFSTKVQLPKSELPDLSAFVKASDFLEGAGAPTTETVASFVGALYLDTTNNNTYQCTVIDEATPSYTWVQLIRETDYATASKAGVVVINDYGFHGLKMINNGLLSVSAATNSDIDNGSNVFKPIVANNYKYAVKKAITTNTETWTNDEKATACETIGAVVKPETSTSYDRVVFFPGRQLKPSYLYLSDAANANGAAVKRNANAEILAATPTAESSVNALTTREYVDDFIAELRAEIDALKNG